MLWQSAVQYSTVQCCGIQCSAVQWIQWIEKCAVERCKAKLCDLPPSLPRILCMSSSQSQKLSRYPNIPHQPPPSTLLCSLQVPAIMLSYSYSAALLILHCCSPPSDLRVFSSCSADLLFLLFCTLPPTLLLSSTCSAALLILLFCFPLLFYCSPPQTLLFSSCSAVLLLKLCFSPTLILLFSSFSADHLALWLHA